MTSFSYLTESGIRNIGNIFLFTSDESLPYFNVNWTNVSLNDIAIDTASFL